MRKKRESTPRTGTLFPEVDKIIALLSEEPTQDLVILVIPSHDRKNTPLGEARTGQWASQAAKLFADLYRGATAFRAFKGIWKDDDGTYLNDEPITLESYASHDDIQDPTKLTDLVHFAKRMGKELNQAAVMLVIGHVMYYIVDYSGV